MYSSKNVLQKRFTPLGERVYRLMLELVAIPSITGSAGGEVKCADFIYNRLSELDYFKKNPEDLRRIDLTPDPLNRVSICALVRASRPTKKTVILTGHFDVVDVDVCGSLRPWAFDPEEYTRRIAELPLSEEARSDLESGNYVFGRGVMDMKTGISVNMCLLQDYAASCDELDFNVMALLVPDEEGDSVGMRHSVPALVKYQEEEGLDFISCVNTEPVIWGKEPGISFGTIGKMMPFFLCVGKESHVGEYYQGLNSTLIASYLNIAIDGAHDTIETYKGEPCQPCCCLRMRDLRSRYAVTMPERTVVYYNCLTVKRTPASLLNDMREKAKEALSKTFEHVGQTSWPVRVIDVEELLAKAVKMRGGSLADLVAEVMPKISVQDERERNIEFISEILDITDEKGPLVLVGFLPPFYPPRCNEGESFEERALRLAASEVMYYLEEKNFSFKEAEVFQGITDLSYTGFDSAKEEIVPLASNTPLWGWGYEVSLDDLSKINIPSVILGPIGHDAHKIAERVELNYSMNVLPEVIKLFISSVVRYNS